MDQLKLGLLVLLHTHMLSYYSAHFKPHVSNTVVEDT